MVGKHFRTASARRLFSSTALSHFRRDEEGSFIIFSLFIFMLMVMIGGLAIDVMRYENLRTKMQNTIDRAVLAASDLDLDPSITPRDVVDDYLVKAGMGDFAYTVDVEESTVGDDVIGRTVFVTSNARMDTYFMHLMGTPDLPVPVSTRASEGINDVEISLVLDVSGSMGWGTKLPDMQDAAKDFIDEVLANTEDGRVSLSLVPYSTQVNAGADLAAEFNLTGEHNYSHCVDFDATDFTTTTLLPGAMLQRAAHFDPWSSYTEGRVPVADGGDWSPMWVCRTEDAFEITPWSNDPPALKDQIDALTAEGNTSIDVATKWGAALLDPSTAPVLSNLIDSGKIDSDLAGRPSPYTDGTDPSLPDVLKFMIVMTDGINTTQFKMDDAHRSGPSGIWRDPESGRLSRASEENGDRDGDGIWNEPYWLADGWNRNYASEWAAEVYDVDENGDVAIGSDRNAYQMDWSEVFARMPVNDYAYSFFYEQEWDANDYYAARNATRDNVFAGTKDARLDAICTAAKDAGVVIFSIGFEVTDYSAGVMQKCASSANHFFRVDSETFDIAYAFDAIANTINQLKLTQ